MRSKQPKRRNYISGKKDRRINILNMPSNTGNETPNIENNPQPTLHNAAYKMTVSRAEEWYNILNIRYYEHLYERYRMQWADTTDKSGDTLLETEIKIAELPPNKKEAQTNEPKSANDFNKIIPPKSQILCLDVTSLHRYITYTRKPQRHMSQ